MSAWQFTGTNQPLASVDVLTPAPGPGEVVIDVKAAGLCHTDVGVLHDEGWLSTLAKVPITMGHEAAGVVSDLGEGVTDWQVGDRVGLCPTTSLGAPGFMYDGGFGEQIVVGTEALVRIPDNVTMAAGAAGTDAGMTSHSALMTAGQVKAGDKVGIIGIGGLGQIGMKVAILAGAEVWVAETNEASWPLAEQLGAKGVAKSITDFGDVGFDVIVDFAGFDTLGGAVESVRFGGRVVVVGMGRLEATVSTKAMILSAVTIVGSVGGTKEDVAAVYDYIAAGDLTPVLTEITFDGIPDGLQRLHDGQVIGRLVAVRD